VSVTYLEVLARQAYTEAEAQARRVRLTTGLDLLAHGAPLAEYVTRRLDAGHLARSIAVDAGYRDATRVARVLAKSGNAPLGRRLLDQERSDSAATR